MLLIKHKSIETYAGDSNILGLRLFKEGVSVRDWDEWELEFTAKESPEDEDIDAVITRVVSTMGRLGLVPIIPEDTEERVTGDVLYCTVRGQHKVSNGVHVFANFLWKFRTAKTVVDGGGGAPNSTLRTSTGGYYRTSTGGYFIIV